MKKIIDAYVKQNETILEFLDKIGQNYENADTVIPSFADFLIRTDYNAALGVDFANALQLSNDKAIFEQYDLSDISRLFASLIKLQDFNLDTHVEAAHFEWAVMDNGEKARTIATAGIEKAKQKIAELQELLESIISE